MSRNRFLEGGKCRFVDSNGNALSGGKVFFYVAGSSTKKNTYPTVTDANAGTNANTNPVILDSRGEGTIVLKGSYKIVVSPSTDTDPPTSPIYTLDNFNVEDTEWDANNNESMTFTSTASAVNYIDIKNSATGNGPEIRALGDDTNVDLILTPKGTGTFKTGNIGINTNTISSTNTNGNITLTPNGSGAVVLKGLTYPTSDGTNGQVIKTNGSGTLSWTNNSATPGGSNTYVQFNNASAFGGDSGFTYAGSGTATLSTQLSVANLQMATNTISSTNSNGNIILSPNGTGLVIPKKVIAFSAKPSANQSIAASTGTKINLQTEDLDTSGCFDNATNYRFTPTVAGWYMFTLHATFSSTLTSGAQTEYWIAKNGTAIALSHIPSSSTSITGCTTTIMIDMNGSTDYVEGFVYHNDSVARSLNASYVRFSGYMVYGT